jgi:hypothetical protein
MMDKDYLNILVLGHTTFGVRRLRVKKESFRIGVYLIVFFQLAITFFLCDYIQVKKKNFLLNQLRQESQIQRSQIQLFSANIQELEKKLSKLRDVDRRIRTIANLERGQEIIPFIGMGGLSPSVAYGKSKEETKKSKEETKEVNLTAPQPQGEGLPSIRAARRGPLRASGSSDSPKSQAEELKVHPDPDFSAPPIESELPPPEPVND